MFILETINTEGIAQLSYLVGDTETGNAALIDPRTDVGIYQALARKNGLAITHIFETHIHADFASGSRSLANLVGNAEIFLSGENADYDFEHRKVRDGDVFDFGKFLLTARHSPGHTPEHLSYEISESKEADRVWAVFSGDSLFVGSAGRPDLLGSGQADELAAKLYHTLYDYYLKLDDHIIVYPGHGAGSACGASISDRLSSTIGYERRTNKFLQFPDFESFRHFVVDEAPPVPAHYPMLKQVNVKPEIMQRLPTIPALPPHDFRAASREPGVTVIDTRSMLAFGGGHVPGAINIGDRPDLSPWIGQMYDLDHDFLLVVDDEPDVEEIQRLIVRTGHFNFAGYLSGGMKAWETGGLPLEKQTQLTVQELHEIQSGRSKTLILDVRSPDEWDKGYIPGARHYYVADMRNRIDGLEKDQAIACYCGSGYRASLAASLMKSRGFTNVSNVTGSWDAWLAKNLPIEKPELTKA